MNKRGIVIAVDGDMATIELSENTKCDTCPNRKRIGACESCSDYSDIAQKRFVAKNKIGAEIGDFVEYGRAPSEGLVFTFIVFALPIIAAIMSYFISVLFTDDNDTMARIALATFGVATVLACFFSWKRSKRHCDYLINKVIDSEE